MNLGPHPYQGCALPPELQAHHTLTMEQCWAEGVTGSTLESSTDFFFFEGGEGITALPSRCWGLLRKEVIQPQLPLRLPCYDFAPVTDHTLDGCLRLPLSTHRPNKPMRSKGQPVGPPASGAAGFRGVTGGVYKARERIHRRIADRRLLATPASRRRVAACDPN